MDIQEEGEFFEIWWKNHGQYNRAGGGDYEKTFAWESWIAAKAHAIPEGFVVVPKEPTSEMLIAADDCEIDGKVTANNIYKAMIEAQEPNQPAQFNLDEFLSMEQKLKSKGGVIASDLDRFTAYAEMVLEKAKALKEPK